MNNRIIRIATIMIFVLIVLLLVIFYGYISTRDISTNIKGRPHVSENSVSFSSGDKVLVSGEDNDLEKISGEENQIEVTASAEIEKNPEPIIKDEPTKQETKVEEDNGENEQRMPDTIIEIPNENDNDRIIQEPIISSSIETSNEEKRQVLNELDSALQGLLEAVGNVPTVDEDKLNASLTESEVAPWLKDY